MPFPATNPALERALAARNYAEPTPVQDAVLQTEARARDLLVSAQTGSGKTVAYGLAFADTLLGEQARFAPATTPLSLVIAPTRELAMQVQRELAWLYEYTGARIVSCIGGMDGRAEARALQGGCHIVVGTPGRLCDHLERVRLDLAGLKVAVLDEADEMLKLGFREELERLLTATPATRRTMLFSATIARDIAALAKTYQTNALRIDTLVRNQQHADIEYRAVRVNPNDIEHAVVNVLRYFEAPTALVFCAMRDEVRHLYGSLLERGFTAVALSGELSQQERTRALQSMRDGQARVCVATDVAARGLDLPDLELVIHATLPVNPASLLHRSGRTGRAGRKGTSILIVPASRARRAEQLLFAAGVTAQWSGPPAPDNIRDRDTERLLRDPLLTDETSPEDKTLVQTLLAGRSAEDIAAALIRLYRSRLPAPEEISEPYAAPERKPERPSNHLPNIPHERQTRDQRRTDSKRPPEDTRPRTVRDNDEPMAWFTMNIGRQQKADPKWLIPLICRQGSVTKQDIGPIRIFDTETKFGIRQSAAPGFQSALPPNGADEVVIRQATGAPPASSKPQGPPSGGNNKFKKHKGKPFGDKKRKKAGRA